MRIGCLQFAPQVGEVSNNISRAEAVLSRANPQELGTLDLLVLPEMALSGYNFKSLEHITPYLEPTGSGISAQWARKTARRYGCAVAVGYPETAGPQDSSTTEAELYNSLVMVNSHGERLAHTRKSFLYYTDETWAREGGGFYGGQVPGLGKVAIGICMDINPYKFEAPWDAYEFANHVLRSKANLVILSTAWLTNDEQSSFLSRKEEPDMSTLAYWAARFEPVIRAGSSEETIIVIANRCGTEGDATYVGTSTVLGIRDGEIALYDLLPRGTEGLLVVDTDKPPKYRLVSSPRSRRDSSSTDEGGPEKGPRSTGGTDDQDRRDSAPPGRDSGSSAVDSPTIPAGFQPGAHGRTRTSGSEIPMPLPAATTSASQTHSPSTPAPTSTRRTTLPGRPKLSLQTNFSPSAYFLSASPRGHQPSESAAATTTPPTTTAADIPIFVEMCSPEGRSRWESSDRRYSSVNHSEIDDGGANSDDIYGYVWGIGQGGTLDQNDSHAQHHRAQDQSQTQDWNWRHQGSQRLLSPQKPPSSDRRMMMTTMLLSPSAWSASASPIGCRMEIPILASPSVFRSDGACW